MVKISVIIPVYNVEKYLRQCLDSICSQTFKDIEIICVNDGSADGSLDILKEYRENDERISIYTQENRGAGASRNLGIDHATGEYVYFMDSDDYINQDALEILSSYFDKNPDFVMLKVSNFYQETNERIDDDYYSMPYLKERVGSNPFSYDDVKDFAMDLCVCPYACIFRREFLSDIRFPEGLLFEDNVFFTHALFKADTIYFHDEFLYNRRKHLESTTAPLTLKSLDTIEITNMLLDLCNRFNHPRHKRALYYRIFNNIYQIFKRADESQKDAFFERIKHDYSKSREKWENDDYFNEKLNPRYKHIYKCAIKSRNARKFEKCVDNYSKDGRLKRLRNKLL